MSTSIRADRTCPEPRHQTGYSTGGFDPAEGFGPLRVSVEILDMWGDKSQTRGVAESADER